jgi:hypothetical protein
MFADQVKLIGDKGDPVGFSPGADGEQYEIEHCCVKIVM